MRRSRNRYDGWAIAEPSRRDVAGDSTPSWKACVSAGLDPRVRTVVVCATALTMIVSFTGCGARGDGPSLAPVTGRVLIDGKAIQGIAVTFLPDNTRSTSGPASVGVTDAAGAFTLTAPGNRPGAVVGHHKVTVACPFDPAGGSSPTGEAPSSGAIRCSIPANYTDPGTTPLAAEVAAGPAGTNDVALDVTLDASRRQ